MGADCAVLTPVSRRSTPLKYTKRDLCVPVTALVSVLAVGLLLLL